MRYYITAEVYRAHNVSAVKTSPYASKVIQYE